MKSITLTPIGTVRSCFRERFGIPRQSGLIPEARGLIELEQDVEPGASLTGLEGFSHIWLITHFHHPKAASFQAKVRPPRLGGDCRMGLFATRSPHRPCPLGLSLVKLEAIEQPNRLHVSGIDILDGTPVMDIKPYLSYADSVLDANSGWTENLHEKETLFVDFTPAALTQLHEARKCIPDLEALIRGVIGQQPEPASQSSSDRLRGVRLYHLDIRWHHPSPGRASVCEIETVESPEHALWSPMPE